MAVNLVYSSRMLAKINFTIVINVQKTILIIYLEKTQVLLGLII